MDEKDIPYAMPTQPAGWRWPAIQQHDFTGALVFQHACRAKESIVSGDSLNNIHNREIVYQAARDLKQHWYGRIFGWENMTADERCMADGLINQRYEYDRIGIGMRHIRLGPDGTIPEGGAKCEKRWSICEIDNQFTLVIVGEAHKGSEVAMMLLTQREDGVWVGAWQTYEKNLVELRPLKEAVSV